MNKENNNFESYCTRMWLDNEDENLTLPAAGNRLSKDQYVEKYYDWLWDKFLLEKWHSRIKGSLVEYD